MNTIRWASIADSTFRDYTANVLYFLDYLSFLDVFVLTNEQLDVVLADYGLYLYDLSTSLENSQSMAHHLRYHLSSTPTEAVPGQISPIRKSLGPNRSLQVHSYNLNHNRTRTQQVDCFYRKHPCNKPRIIRPLKSKRNLQSPRHRNLFRERLSSV